MNHPVKILFAVENREEFNELIVLVRELLSGFEPERKFILFRTHPIFHLDDYSLEYSFLFEKIYTARNPFNINFKRLSILKKVMILLSNMTILIRIIHDQKINYMLSGVPLIFHRLVRLFSPRIIHLAYIRGLLLYSQKTTSVSDQFFFLSKNIFGLTSIRFFNNYFADYLFTIGAINKKTLMERHIPEANIYLSGPLLLDQYRKLDEKEESHFQKKELVYITQAYLWHLNIRGHAEQLASIENLLTEVSDHYPNDFTIIIRVHPRDEKDVYQELIKKYPLTGRIDTSAAPEFLGNISRQQVLVSGLSTLAFEWIYLGGFCIFYSTKNLFLLSKEMYDGLKISPFLDVKEMLESIRSEQYPDHQDLMEKIFYRHPSTNLVYMVNMVNSIIKR